MPQVHLTVALTLDTGIAADRAVLARILASDPREPAPVEEPTQDQPPAQDEPPAEEAPSAATQARQAAAAKARAAKAAKQAQAANGDAAADLAGPGTSDADPVEDLGLDDPSMSPTEARDAGLAVVREIYAAGKVAEVKMLQKHYGVAKFYDVPAEQGHAFHRHVLDVARSVGLRP